MNQFTNYMNATSKFMPKAPLPDSQNIVHALESPIHVITEGPPPQPEHYVAAYSPHIQDVHSINDASLTQPIIHSSSDLLVGVAIGVSIWLLIKILK